MELGVIKIEYPSGFMRINAETFFKEARKSQIRKALKLLRDDPSSSAEVKELKEWLQDHIKAEQASAKQQVTDYVNLKTIVKEQQELYRRMKSPVYPDYTNDRERLEEQRKKVKSLEADCRKKLEKYRHSQKLEVRYQGIVQDVEKIFG